MASVDVCDIIVIGCHVDNINDFQMAILVESPFRSSYLH